VSYPIITVSIVDDDVRVRSTLARLIDRSDGFECASQHPTAENALAELPAVRPDVVLMDINLPGMSGIECVRRLRRVLPPTQIVMLTVYEDTDLIFSALSAGAAGYLLKRTRSKDLLAGIRDVHGGGSPMTSDIARKVVQLFQSVPPPAESAQVLSPREAEVLDGLVKGYPYKEIAGSLGISYETVHTHIRRVYEKLEVHSRGEAMVKCLGQAQSSRALAEAATRAGKSRRQ
jgi:DNA-binding NarL/FixJ family response regulator